MKAHIRILTMAVALCAALALPAFAAEKDGHKHKATPKGGRLLDKTEPHAEFVVEKDRSVTINFYSEEMKPIAATTQSVTAIADAKSGKATLQFEKKGDVLVSNSKLPEGDGYNIVVQFKQTADAKPLNLRFKLDLKVCGECKRAEYACICDH
jgi:glucan biosynthesis protein